MYLPILSIENQTTMSIRLKSKYERTAKIIQPSSESEKVHPQEFFPRQEFAILGPCQLSIVGGGLGDLLGLEHNVLDNDLSVGMAGELDPGSGRLQDTGSNEEVVGVALGGDPSLALVGADLQALGTASGVLNSSCEPVLRSTAVHVNAQRVGDGALDELPLDTVNSACGDAAGEFGPGGGSHVEMVLVSASLVGDLFGNESVGVHSFDRTSGTYHYNDLLSFVSNADATTAVRAGVPDVLRHTGRSIDG
jgi:hypothetical protein